MATLLPGTSYTLGSAYAPAREMIAAGATVALASDFNPGTCHCENLQAVISLACQSMRLTPDEALYAVTVGGAAALRRGSQIGSLEVGKRCDFAVLGSPSRTELPYHFGVNLVTDVVLDGRPVVLAGQVVDQTVSAAGVPAPLTAGEKGGAA